MDAEAPRVILVPEAEFTAHAAALEGLCLACGEWVPDIEAADEDELCRVCGERRVWGVEAAQVAGEVGIA